MNQTFATVYEPGSKRDPVPGPYAVPVGLAAGDMGGTQWAEYDVRGSLTLRTWVLIQFLLVLDLSVPNLASVAKPNTIYRTTSQNALNRADLVLTRRKGQCAPLTHQESSCCSFIRLRRYFWSEWPKEALLESGLTHWTAFHRLLLVRIICEASVEHSYILFFSQIKRSYLQLSRLPGCHRAYFYPATFAHKNMALICAYILSQTTFLVFYRQVMITNGPFLVQSSSSRCPSLIKCT